jgi:uncharacterized protein (DUF433 family)
MKYTISLDECMPRILGRHATWTTGVCDGLDYLSDYYRPYSVEDLAGLRGHEYTEEQIAADADLRDALTQAAERLDERAGMDGAYQSHRDMCERVVAFLENELNDLAGDKEAIALSIDWREQVLDVDVKDAPACARVVLEIIHGEGMFRFDSLNEFLAQGPYKDEFEAVRKHEHYLLNLPLIMDIWGVGHRSLFEYRECYGTVSPDDIKECMDEALSEYADKVKERERIYKEASDAYASASSYISPASRAALEAYAPSLKKLI